MLDQIAATWRALPYAGPAMLLGLLLAVVSLRLGGRRSRRDLAATAVLVWWAVVTAVTATTPVGGRWRTGAPVGRCVLDLWQPLSPLRWWETSSDALNVWFFVPAGLAAVLLDRGRRRWAIGLVLATPLLCEAAQLLIPAAGRVCIAEDVANNWVGAALGMATGCLIGRQRG